MYMQQVKVNDKKLRREQSILKRNSYHGLYYYSQVSVLIRQRYISPAVCQVAYSPQIFPSRLSKLCSVG